MKLFNIFKKKQAPEERISFVNYVDTVIEYSNDPADLAKVLIEYGNDPDPAAFTKIVINDCYGGFGISEKAINRLKQLGLHDANKFYFDDYILRSDPMLVQVVEELGSEASGKHAELIIKEIPYQVDWDIDDYDGIETVVEKNRTW